MSFDIKGNTLRPADPRKEPLDVPVRRDAIDRIEARSCRAGNVKIVVKTKREMVRRDARLERCEHKDLAARIDFENASASVADIEIALMIEGDAGRDSHSFRIQLRAPCPVHSIYVSFVSAGYEQVAVQIERQTSGIHDVRHEGGQCAFRRDLVERNGRFLAAPSAVGRVDVAITVDGGIGDW